MKYVFWNLAFCLLLGGMSEGQWQRETDNLLANFNNMYNPCVVETGGDYRYKMWFFGWAANHSNKNIHFHQGRIDLLNEFRLYLADNMNNKLPKRLRNKTSLKKSPD